MDVTITELAVIELQKKVEELEHRVHALETRKVTVEISRADTDVKYYLEPQRRS